MHVADKRRKNRIFIASSKAHVAEVQKATLHFDLDGVLAEASDAPSH
jgi:hypothetical protein